MASFEPATPLERLIHGGDGDATLALLRTMDDPQRQKARPALRAMHALVEEARWKSNPQAGGWGAASTLAQQRALGIALLLCGTAADARSVFLDEADLVPVFSEMAASRRVELVDAWLAHSPGRIVLVTLLVSAGLVPRPDSQDYTLGLIALPMAVRDAQRLEELFAADAGLRGALLRVFDIEGTQDNSLAGSDKYMHSPALQWDTLLLDLVPRGLATRAGLLERTLGVLESDWPQFRAGWFSRFHGRLAPTADEMRAHAGRYLGLLHSRIAPTVTLALEALHTLHGARALDDAALLAALEPVFSSAVRAQVEAACRLADSVVARQAARGPEASAMAMVALVHEAAPLQKLVLKRLAAWTVRDADRPRLAALGSGVAAANRPAFDALCGGAVPGDAAPAPLLAAPTPQARVITPLDVDRALPPVRDIDELVALVGQVFEQPTDPDAVERAIAGLVQFAPFDAAARRRLSPLIKRAPKLRRAIACELADLLLRLAQEEPALQRPRLEESGGLCAQWLAARLASLALQAARGLGLPPLGTPTHRRGFIAPEALVARAAAYERASCDATVAEQVLALLRLAPGPAQAALLQTRTLRASPFTRALRHALGDAVTSLHPTDDAELFYAAARARHPGAEDPVVRAAFGDGGPDGAVPAQYQWQVTPRSWEADGKTYQATEFKLDAGRAPRDTPLERLAVARHMPAGLANQVWNPWSFGGSSEAALRYAATLCPRLTEGFFAEGALAVGGNIDWWEARWRDRAYLELLLDPTVTLGPQATLLLALGLMSKEPGQAQTAVDALVAARAEQRLDEGALALAVRDLLACGHAKAARLHKSLRAALRASPAFAGTVIDVTLGALKARPDDPPRDTAVLLELLQECVLTERRPLRAPECETVAALRLGGRGRSVQRELLGAG